MLSEKPWKPEQVVFFILGTVVCFGWVSLAGGAVQHFSGQGKLDEHSLLYVLFATMSLHGSILLATALALWWFHISWREAFGFSTGGAGRAVLLGSLAGAVFLPIGWFLLTLSTDAIARMHPNTPVPVQQAVEMLQTTDSWKSRAYFVLYSISIVPAAEEILFRGVLYPAAKQAGFPRIALWGTAILFAAIHANLAIFLPMLVLGLALALLYELTNNLLACITAHGLFNAVNIAVMFHQDSLQQLHK
jgi:membrane protease YdiL (CAAX protease family)